MKNLDCFIHILEELIPNEEPRRKERQKDLVDFILTIKDKLQKLSPFENDFLDIVKINDEESERPSNWLILVSQKVNICIVSCTYACII